MIQWTQVPKPQYAGARFYIPGDQGADGQQLTAPPPCWARADGGSSTSSSPQLYLPSLHCSVCDEPAVLCIIQCFWCVRTILRHSSPSNKPLRPSTNPPLNGTHSGLFLALWEIINIRKISSWVTKQVRLLGKQHTIGLDDYSTPGDEVVQNTWTFQAGGWYPRQRKDISLIYIAGSQYSVAIHLLLLLPPLLSPLTFLFCFFLRNEFRSSGIAICLLSIGVWFCAVCQDIILNSRILEFYDGYFFPVTRLKARWRQWYRLTSMCKHAYIFKPFPHLCKSGIGENLWYLVHIIQKIKNTFHEY